MVLSQLEKPEILDSSLINKRTISVNSQSGVKQDTDLLYDTDLESHYNDEKLDTDEQISISTILYDLGCLLLNVSKSEILRKEGIDCLRRCMDIKTLIYDANNIECQIVKSLLTNFEIKNNINNEVNGKKNNNLLKSFQNLAINITPRDKTLKSLETVRKEIRNDEIHEKMSDWILKNSYIETIKPIESKTDLNSLPSSDLTRNASRFANLGSRQRSTMSARIPSSYSAYEYRCSQSANSDSYHKQKCYLPSAFSVDIHNSTSVHGPNSAVRDILSVSLRDKTKYKPHSAILKPIYYKSAWYDRPHGSSKMRFKKFQKLDPNSYDKSFLSKSDLKLTATALNSAV